MGILVVSAGIGTSVLEEDAVLSKLSFDSCTELAAASTSAFIISNSACSMARLASMLFITSSLIKALSTGFSSGRSLVGMSNDDEQTPTAIMKVSVAIRLNALAVLPILHQIYACHEIEGKGEGIIAINDDGIDNNL
uniref:Uncharacterized protein n=1 Tax=Glossina pallidipes TaxID=7398 RepID=A0A1A9ZB91_GLOPL